MSKATRVSILAVLVLAVAVTVALRRDERGSSRPQSAGASAALPRLVDVGSESCIPCKAMAPILEELRREYAGRLQVDFIDAWKFPERAEPFRVSVIPVQIFMDPTGRELHRHLGFISKEEILATWEKLGFRLAPGQKS